MSDLPQFPVQGGCMCGEVRYSLKAAPLGVYTCHCKDCQRASNGTHTISMVAKAGDADLISGELVSFDKTADSGNVVRMYRCAKCGTGIWNEPLASPGMLIMKAGTLDDISWAEPIGNIWTASKAPWVQIDLAEPNFAKGPTDRAPLLDAWAAAHSA